MQMVRGIHGRFRRAAGDRRQGRRRATIGGDGGSRGSVRVGKLSGRNPSQTDVEKADDDQEYDPFVSVVFERNRGSVVTRCRLTQSARRDLSART